MNMLTQEQCYGITNFEQIQESFKNHEAVFDFNLNQLTFKEPETTNWYIKYSIINDRYLVVIGDLGDAIYHWNDKITFGWISGLNLDYFAGKCQASEEGRGFKVWSSEKAKETLKWHIDQCVKDDPDKEKPDEELISRAKSATESQEEWCNFLASEDWELFGDDLWEYTGIGMVVAQRCAIHLMGLKVIYHKYFDEHGDRR